MKLFEIDQQHQEKWLQAQKWADQHLEMYAINDDCTITVEGDVSLNTPRFRKAGYTQLPVQFKNVTGNFHLSGVPLTTMIGFPQIVGGDVTVTGTKITSIEGLPQQARVINLTDNESKRTGISLRGVSKWVKRCEVFRTDYVSEGGLGLVLIKDLFLISLKPAKLCQILNKGATGLGAGSDLHEVQELLIDAGLAKFAKL